MYAITNEKPMADAPLPSHALPSPDLIRLEQDAAEITSHARSANTIRAYRNDWAHFSSWCCEELASRRSQPFPGLFRWHRCSNLKTA